MCSVLMVGCLSRMAAITNSTSLLVWEWSFWGIMCAEGAVFSCWLGSVFCVW